MTKTYLPHRGFTLIETVLVFGLELVVFAVAVGLLLLVSETRVKLSHSEPAHLAAQRLAVQFRSDVHHATKMNVENEQITLSLSSGEEAVYTVEQRDFPEQKWLRRIEQKDGKLIRQEHYAVPDYSAVWFTQGKDNFAGLTALSIWTQPVTPDGKELVPFPKPETLNPFTRETADEKTFDPRYAGRWRTVIAASNGAEK